MTRVIVDANLLTRLNGLRGPLEFCDESGRVLGHFVPGEVLRPDEGCPYTPEQLARFQGETGGRSLAEIWKRLGRA